MEFVQKRMATHMRFAFDATELRFWIRDNSGENEITFDYSQIPRKSRRVFERNMWVRNVGVLWCVLGVVMVGLAVAGARPLAGSGFWLLLGLGCLIFYWLTQTKYTVMDTDAGTLWIMDGQQSEQILAELQSRRKNRLLELYGEYNAENDAEREIQKFDWLVKEEVLSREEADKRIATAKREAGLLAPPQRLLN